MKKIFTLLIVLCACNKESIAWDKGAFENIFEINNDNKIIMLDFYAVWWGPCKMLDANTFSNDNVINYSDFAELYYDYGSDGCVDSLECGDNVTYPLGCIGDESCSISPYKIF